MILSTLGLIAVVGGTLGQFLGGLFVTKFKMSVTGILKYCMAFSLFSFMVSFIYIYTCDNTG